MQQGAALWQACACAHAPAHMVVLAVQADELMKEFDEVYATLELPDPCHDTGRAAQLRFERFPRF